MSSAYAAPARAASEPSSFSRSSMRWPMSPPAAFASSAHRTRPLRYSAAAAACEPVSEMTAPTTSAPSWAATAEASARPTSALVVQPVIDRVAAHRDERRALEGHEDDAVGLLAGGAHGDDAVVRPRLGFALGDDFRFGIDGVAGEDRGGEAHLVPAEVGDGLLAHVGDAHAGDDGERERGVDERPLEFGAGAVHRVDVQRMLVHRQEREPDVVGLGERAARPVLVHVAELEVLVVAPRRLAETLRCHFLCATDHKRIP